MTVTALAWGALILAIAAALIGAILAGAVALIRAWLEGRL